MEHRGGKRRWYVLCTGVPVALTLACSSSSTQTQAPDSGLHREAGVGAARESGVRDHRDAAPIVPGRSDAGATRPPPAPTHTGSPQKPPPPPVEASVGTGSVSSDAGASCDDPSCRCDGFHPCAAGCCAFTVTTLVTPADHVGVNALDIAVATDGTIHAIIGNDYLTYVTLLGGKRTREELGGGAGGPVAITLDGTSPVISFNTASPPITGYVMHRGPSGWMRPEPVFSLLSENAVWNLLAFDPSGALQHVLLYNYVDLLCQVDTPTDAGTPVEYTAYDGDQVGVTGYGFDGAGNPFVSAWASMSPAGVTVHRHLGHGWTTATFSATSFSDGLPGVGTVDADGNPSFFYKGEYHSFGPSGEKVEDTTATVTEATDLRTAANGNIAFIGLDVDRTVVRNDGITGRIAVVLRTAAGWSSGWLGSLSSIGAARLTMAPDGLPVACWTPGPYGTGGQTLSCAKW